jgi:FkbM family methyltransferase
VFVYCAKDFFFSYYNFKNVVAHLNLLFMNRILLRVFNSLFFNLGLFSKKLRSLVDYFYKKSKNLNYDFDTNGELLVLKIISRYNFRTFFDVGANEGNWAKLLGNLNSNAMIYSFEIVPDTFLRLKENLSNISNVRFFDFGLSNFCGNVTINFSNEDNKLSSLIAGQEIHNITWNKVDCMVVTGDQFCKDEGIVEIDFLKIDTEGSENLVLDGLNDMFKSQSVNIVQFEYGMTNIYSKYLLKDYYAFFNSLGFKVGKILPSGVEFSDYNPQMEDFLGPNYIAVSNKFPQLILDLSFKI